MIPLTQKRAAGFKSSAIFFSDSGFSWFRTKEIFMQNINTHLSPQLTTLDRQVVASPPSPCNAAQPSVALSFSRYLVAFVKFVSSKPQTYSNSDRTLATQLKSN